MPELDAYFRAVDRYFKKKTDANDEALSRAINALESPDLRRLGPTPHVICSKGSCGCQRALEGRRQKKASTTHLRRRDCHPDVLRAPASARGRQRANPG